MRKQTTDPKLVSQAERRKQEAAAEVASWPDLNQEQIDTLAVLLRPIQIVGRVSDDAKAA